MKIHWAVRKALRVGAAVILGMFAAVILFLLLAGCSSLSEGKAGKSQLKVEVEGVITKLEVECGSEVVKEYEETENLQIPPPTQ